MKIGIIGASGAELASIRIAMEKANHEVIVICEDDVKKSDAIVLSCGTPLPDIGDCILEYKDDSYDDGTQHWRGGSRGKGGKIKYAGR